EQLQLKASVLSVLDCVRDESSKDAAVRLVFEPKSRTVEQQDLISTLLAHTSLETSASINMTMIGADGRPTLKSLRQILSEWLGYRQQTVQRRTQHRLAKVLDRIHVLEGRALVLLNIDEVIRIIRNADEPKPALINRFNLSDRQAEDILEIRLRQLARLEAIKIEQELKTLREEQSKLEEILANPGTLKRTVIREIEADAKQFGDERRTLIQEEKKATAEVRIVDEAVTVVVSGKGWVRALKGHEIESGALAFKSGDQLYGTFQCRSVDALIVFGSNGRVYSVAVALLPGGRGDGQPITSLIELESGSQIAHYFAGSADARLVLAGTGGFGLIAKIGDLVGRQKAGKTFLSLEGDEKVLPPAAVPTGAVLGVQLACLTLNGRLLTYALDELKHQPKGGRGLTLIDLEPKDALLSVAAFTQALQVLGTGRGAKPREEILKGVGLASYAGKRARKGKPVEAFQKVLRVVTP
uniref:DNA gyrase subunit A n=1 Tax=Roseateles sp. TaxID=1971397 RepID=UPI00286CBC8E